MADKTGIEWTNATWNPIAGCNDVSEGCRHCYARGMTRRLELMGSAKYTGLTVLQGSHAVWTGKISFDEGMLLQPLRWKKPRKIFVNSMSDLFHENVTDEMRDRIFAVMALCPQHVFQVLTKRPERMLAYVGIAGQCSRVLGRMRQITGLAEARLTYPLPNVWLGVSVENQKAAGERIPLLLQTPAAVRFLSCEPLLGPLSLRWLCGWGKAHPRHRKPEPDAQGRISTDEYDGLRELDWVIAGGESGPNARPLHPDWARSLRDQCAIAGVPFFFKQWGEWAPAGFTNFISDRLMNFPGGQHMERVGKKAAGHLLDGAEHHAFPPTRLV